MIDKVKGFIKTIKEIIAFVKDLKGGKKAIAKQLVESLDNLEPELAKAIDKRMTSEKIAKVVIDFIQKKLNEGIDKIL